MGGGFDVRFLVLWGFAGSNSHQVSLTERVARPVFWTEEPGRQPHEASSEVGFAADVVCLGDVEFPKDFDTGVE